MLLCIDEEADERHEVDDEEDEEQMNYQGHIYRYIFLQKGENNEDWFGIES